MSYEERKEYAELHFALTTLLTKCKTDKQFLKRLLWAKTIIEGDLKTFSNEEINEVSNS